MPALVNIPRVRQQLQYLPVPHLRGRHPAREVPPQAAQGEEVDNLVQATAALWGVRRSAPQPKRVRPWDVCYNCMEALRTGLSKEQKKQFPKTVNVMQVYTIAILKQLLGRVQALHESAQE